MIKSDLVGNEAVLWQAKQRAMEDMTPGQASVLARNERQIEQIQVAF